MSAVPPVSLRFRSALSLDQVHTAVLQTLRVHGAEIRYDLPDRIAGALGSAWKARILGVPVAGIEVWPREVTASFQIVDDGTEVTIEVKDDFGMGSRVLVEDQVRQLMERDADIIKAALEPRGNSEPSACRSCGAALEGSVRFCPSCGIAVGAISAPRPASLVHRQPAQPMQTTVASPFSTGVRMGAGIFIAFLLMPFLLLGGSCIACTACMGVASAVPPSAAVADVTEHLE